MKKYLMTLSALIIVAILIIAFAGSKFEPGQQMVCWYLLAYFSLVTILSHLGLERSAKSRPQVFVRYYMASTSMRLLAHLIVIVIYSLLNPPNAWFFIITFMIMYFIFTIFEVMYVLKFMKEKNS